MCLGLLAGVLTTAAGLPQAIKSWKTKKTEDISLAMYLMLFTGVLLWEVYGLAVHDIPVIVANAVTAVIIGSVLGLKIKYG